MLIVLLGIDTSLAGGDVPTKFSNQGGIVNTRHNLTQGPIGSGEAQMDPYRNDYGEVCVYCHTPHGASSSVAAPLWNRTATASPYTTYDTLGTATLNGTVSQPGVNSLTCLSCHDGTIAIDSIINMPGPGGYSASQETSVSETFLDSWSGNGTGGTFQDHSAFGPDDGDGAWECMTCHSPSGPSSAADFTAMAIGTDLTDDHPIGIPFAATGLGVDFNPTTGTGSGMTFFDDDGDGRADTDEIRLYDTGEGPEVECASCHDPHGVPSAGAGSTINPTFLRVSNAGSQVCLTCHIK